MLTNLPLKIALSVVVIGLMACYGIRCIVFSKIENQLPGLLQELEQRNIKASVQSIETSWYDNRISLKGIALSNEEPNSLPMSISEANISSIVITGVELLPLLVNKKLNIDSLIIGKVKLTKYKAAKTPKKNDVERSFRLAYIKIDSLEITELDSLDKTVATTRFSFETHDLVGSLPLVDLNTNDLTISGLKMLLPKSNYLITFNELRLESMDHFIIDSLRVIPLYGKKEFIKRAPYETDRIDCVFPSIEVTGFNHLALLKNQELAIHQIELSFNMAVYRDKRAKDLKKYKALPDSLLRGLLPLSIIIDTIKLTSSQLVYEEFGEKADSSGQVVFKKLEASIYNISNRDPKKALELTAQAQFMNDGEIRIHGKFSNSDKHYLEGSLKNFRLSKINQMLKPATGVMIESGRLELMKFAFWYNNYQSDGELTLNYHDLKLLSLRENRKDEVVKNVAKTLLINAFVENDLDKNDSKAKRTGTIHFVRDRNKFIFNFWWKSLLSGLKSASGVPGPKPEAAS